MCEPFYCPLSTSIVFENRRKKRPGVPALLKDHKKEAEGKREAASEFAEPFRAAWKEMVARNQKNPGRQNQHRGRRGGRGQRGRQNGTQRKAVSFIPPVMSQEEAQEWFPEKCTLSKNPAEGRWRTAWRVPWRGILTAESRAWGVDDSRGALEYLMRSMWRQWVDATDESCPIEGLLT